jgi:hypothetical protein
MKHRIIQVWVTCMIGLLSVGSVQGQDRTPPVLPEFSALIKTGKIQLDWISGFPNALQIGIQRSLDSVLNFTTIGYATDPGLSRNAYLDNKPLPGKNYYRLFILLNNRTYLYSNTVLAIEDTTIDATHRLTASDIPTSTAPSKKEAVIPWKPSNYVYTTADGNVNIRLPQAPKKKYQIKFFEPSGAFLFEIEQVLEPFLIMEKAIFMRAGWFDFEIYEDGVLLEKWNLFIPLNYRS